jgi:hypothetical protein
MESSSFPSNTMTVEMPCCLINAAQGSTTAEVSAALGVRRGVKPGMWQPWTVSSREDAGAKLNAPRS